MRWFVALETYPGGIKPELSSFEKIIIWLFNIRSRISALVSYSEKGIHCWETWYHSHLMCFCQRVLLVHILSLIYDVIVDM